RNSEKGAVLSNADGLKVVHALAALDAGNNFRLFTATVGGDDKSDVLADGFVGCIAKQPFRAFVPTGDDTIQILADNRVIGRIHNGSEQASGAFSSVANGNVAGDTEMNDLPVGLAKGDTTG